MDGFFGYSDKLLVEDLAKSYAYHEKELGCAVR
jgi:hypothetical protein